ncbi:MAG TPA: DUF309 domain-containing protein [Dehalococcoidia bacterium]|nr:DUF309 domain-containing protein [Dehalococcoidia bacterium]
MRQRQSARALRYTVAGGAGGGSPLEDPQDGRAGRQNAPNRATGEPAQPHRSSPSGRCSEAAPPPLLQGIDEFNRRLFFEQHETLEDAWIEESDPVRYLYQGILQIGVAFYHLSRGNYRGATALMDRGMSYLRPFAPTCMTVDVARLLADTDGAHSALLRLGPERLAAFDEALIPHIHLVERSAPLPGPASPVQRTREQRGGPQRGN